MALKFLYSLIVLWLSGAFFASATRNKHRETSLWFSAAAGASLLLMPIAIIWWILVDEKYCIS